MQGCCRGLTSKFLVSEHESHGVGVACEGEEGALHLRHLPHAPDLHPTHNIQYITIILSCSVLYITVQFTAQYCSVQGRGQEHRGGSKRQ